MVKTVEATAQVVSTMLRSEVRSAVGRAVGARLIAPLMRRFRERTDVRTSGGALLLGVRGVVVVGHGRSDARAVTAAIRHAADVAASGLVERTGDAIERALVRPLPSAPGSR